MLKVEAYLYGDDSGEPVEHLTEGMGNIVYNDTDRLEVKFNRYVSEDEFSRGINFVFKTKPTRVIHRVKLHISFFEKSSVFRTYLVEIDDNTPYSPFNAACFLIRKDFGGHPANIRLVESEELGEIRKV